MVSWPLCALRSSHYYLIITAPSASTISAGVPKKMLIQS
ncbi:rCG25547 [Rattus norvegicus]|uniref:RCG25547 n=1 Tax=Rattus norvegicus TaxID=10116 RepID=A6I3T1_RAT|nr:rCG25547 [Rattus norvegicus]